MSEIQENHDINLEFNNDGKLTKNERNRVIEAVSKDLEVLKTSENLRNFISKEFRYANENFLSQGGKSMKNMQSELGFNKPDGIFGPNTFTALIEYQKTHNLDVDGLCGPKTQRELFTEKKERSRPHTLIASEKKNVKNPKQESQMKTQDPLTETGTVYAESNSSDAGFTHSDTNTEGQVHKTNFSLHSMGSMKNMYVGGEKLAYDILHKNQLSPRSGTNCGVNVREAIETYTAIDIPDSNMHGYLWSDYLESNLDKFEKVKISSPAEAKEGGILSYGTGYGSNMRKENGHVEIALGNGEYYWGEKRPYPGGSVNALVENSGFTGYVYYPKSVA